MGNSCTKKHKFDSNGSIEIVHGLVPHKQEDIHEFYDFDEKDILGEGMTGKVVVCTHKRSGAKRALKTIDLRRVREISKLKQEIEIMKQLDHPNIIKLYESYEYKHQLYLVMELAEGGELYDVLRRRKFFTETEAKTVMEKMLSAVAYCHSKTPQIVHRDLKLENFIFKTDFDQKNPTIKLIDFGLSKQFMSEDYPERMKSCVGTAYYIAPEILQGNYDAKCDLWALGVICYMLLSGRPPFAGPNDSTIIFRVTKGQFAFPSDRWGHISNAAKDFVRQLLTVDSKKRPSALQMLKHSWLKQKTPLNRDSQRDSQKQLMDSFRTFVNFSPLKQSVLAIMAYHYDAGNASSLAEAFSLFDKDHSGRISIEEFREAMKTLPAAKDKSPATDAEIEKLFNEIDVANNGSIQYSEFLAANLSTEFYLSQDALFEAFERMDTDGTGYISLENLLEIVGRHETSTNEELIDMLAIADHKGNGHIDYEEFLKIMNDETVGNNIISDRRQLSANLLSKLKSDTECGYEEGDSRPRSCTNSSLRELRDAVHRSQSRSKSDLFSEDSTISIKQTISDPIHTDQDLEHHEVTEYGDEDDDEYEGVDEHTDNSADKKHYHKKQHSEENGISTQNTI